MENSLNMALTSGVSLMVMRNLHLILEDVCKVGEVLLLKVMLIAWDVPVWWVQEEERIGTIRI